MHISIHILTINNCGLCVEAAVQRVRSNGYTSDMGYSSLNAYFTADLKLKKDYYTNLTCNEFFHITDNVVYCAYQTLFNQN